MRWRIPLLLTLLPFLAIGCEQQPTEPTIDHSVVEAPAFNFSNNDGFLAHGRIYRHPHGGLAWWGLDDRSGLVAHFSNESGHYCGYGIDAAPLDAQHVFGEFSHQMEQGDVAVQLFDGSGDWSCSELASRYIGSGMVRWVSTDNDYFAFEGDRNRNNAFGFKANGEVELAGGGTTNLNYMYLQNWSLDKDFENIVERLKISPDPR